MGNLFLYGQSKIDYKNYEIIDKLGEGASGTVYKIRNNIDKNFYAIKMIKGIKEDQFEEAQNEAKILSTLDNEYIIKYYDSFKDNNNNTYNIVMEYCDNSDLKSFIEKHQKENKPIEEKVIHCIILNICYGLKEIHNKNLIHRDIKPANLFISKDYKIKIGDFSISRKIKEKISDDNGYTLTEGIGTDRYMAPELISGEKYNNKIDIWALGCVIYELFNLEFCFNCDSKNIIGLCRQITEDRPKKINTNIYNPVWQELIELLLNKNYKERPDIDSV